MPFALSITRAPCQRCLDPLQPGGFIAWNCAAFPNTFKKEGMNHAKYKTYNGVTSRGTEPIAHE